MECDLVTWANVLMQIDILQSYKTIVTPNEASLVRTSRTKALSESFEGANFLLLQKRYVKIFLLSFNRYKNKLAFPSSLSQTQLGLDEAHQRTLCYIDSDFDTEDEHFADDIEEIISNQHFIQPHASELYSDESSDDIARVEALSRFEPKRRKTAQTSFQQQLKEMREINRKNLASNLIERTPFDFPSFQQASPTLAALAELKSESKNRIFEENIIKFKQDFLNHTAEVLQHV